MESLSLLDCITGKVSVVGSLNADLTVETQHLPRPGETVRGGPLNILAGGKSSNQAAVAAKLGADVEMIGAVGDDAHGGLLLDQLDSAGANVEGVARLAVATGTALISVDAEAENTIIISPGANGQVTPALVRSQQDRITGSSALGLCFEIPMESVVEAARIAYGSGIPVILNLSPFSTDFPSELARYTEVLIVNQHEISWLLGDEHESISWEKRRLALTQRGFTRVVVTLGSDGAQVIEPDAIVHIPGMKVDAVDTTGCGDAFMGTVLAGVASGMGLPDICRLAVLVSAHAARSAGAQPSYATAEELRKEYS